MKMNYQFESLYQMIKKDWRVFYVVENSVMQD